MVKMKDFNAPYFPIIWLDEFLKLIKRVRIDKVDRKWIANNNLCGESNASKVVTGLKFLKLIDVEGNAVAANINQLKLEGDPYKIALQKIAKDAYKDLLSTVDITKAYPVDVLNYFISTYQYSKQQAQGALALFLHLAKQAELQLSNDLSKRKTTSETSKKSVPATDSRKPRKSRSTQKSPEEDTNATSEFPRGSNIVISVKGKGLSHQQEISSFAEIKGTLEILGKLIEIHLKNKNTSEENKE